MPGVANGETNKFAKFIFRSTALWEARPDQLIGVPRVLSKGLQLEVQLGAWAKAVGPPKGVENYGLVHGKIFPRLRLGVGAVYFAGLPLIQNGRDVGVLLPLHVLRARVKNAAEVHRAGHGREPAGLHKGRVG